MKRSRVGRIGSHPVIVWAIKHIFSPVDRFVVRVSRGRIRQPSGWVLSTLLLTVVGRRTGRERTVPLVFVRDDAAFIVANARPDGERRNPWVANLLAAGGGQVKHRGATFQVSAAELGDDELDAWWPALVDVWPAFETHFAATRERTVFRLDPSDVIP
jgi:deazaflavin-dependent oxidoreductase (nitroreductase family)